jgi:P pilus assembly chaperone PapD
MDSKGSFLGRIGKPVRRATAFFLVLLFLTSINLTAGVLVAPTSIILSDHDRTGRMTVQNPTDMPKEVSISFGFGLPESDSLGNVTLRIHDSTGIDHPRSALNWIRAFPRKVVLAPGATQVVRFVARPPKDLPDGEYWARIIVKSQESQPDIPSAASAEQITTRLNMIMQTAIVLKYRTGNLIAKLDIKDTQVEETDSLVAVTIDMANLGNVSYVGILKCRLIDANKQEISHRTINLAVYEDFKRRVDLPITGRNFRRPFEVEVSIESGGRKDIPEEELIHGNSFEYSMMVQ